MNLGFLGGLEPSDFVITISPAIVLGPGHYWMAVQANQSFTPDGQWYWRTRTVTSNSPAAWQNPGGSFGSACTSWGTRFSTCGIVGAEPDQVFRIDGKLAQGTLFCNTSPITSPDYGTASPYPSNILVAGMGISRTDVNVVLVHLSHTFPDDLDFLLVDPGGHNAMVMSDAGGGIDVTLISVTLDDQAASVLPDIAALTAGSFQPANYVTDDPFPPPAPALSGAVNLSTFNGTDPNGTWSLYLWDDQHGDLGSINGGWCLDITASGGKVYLPTVLNAGL
jgi:subtilisin-like proprotein convertase family protein